MACHIVRYYHGALFGFVGNTRWMFKLLVLTMISGNVMAQSPTYPQYSESACLLIADQVKRFQQQPNLPSYQDALKNQRRHCQNPVVQQPKPYFETAKPATKTPVPTVIKVVAPPSVAIHNVMQPLQALTDGLLKQVLWPLLILFAILLLLILLKGRWRFSRNAMLGRQAERQLAKLLRVQLSDGYTHYQNLVLKTCQGDLTEIDHLVVSPFGIFVIEVKNYQGWIFGAAHQEKWVVQHYRRKHSFQNPLRQNFKHTEAVAHVLDIDGKTEPDKIYSVVAFGQRAQFKTQMPDNVLHIEDVHRHIRKITALGRKMSDEAVLRYTARFNLLAADAPSLRKEHKIQQQGQQLLREIN
jgi:hypothetical protein